MVREKENQEKKKITLNFISIIFATESMLHTSDTIELDNQHIGKMAGKFATSAVSKELCPALYYPLCDFYIMTLVMAKGGIADKKVSGEPF